MSGLLRSVSQAVIKSINRKLYAMVDFLFTVYSSTRRTPTCIESCSADFQLKKQYSYFQQVEDTIVYNWNIRLLLQYKICLQITTGVSSIQLQAQTGSEEGTIQST